MGAFMFIQQDLANYLEDMTPHANVEFGDFGARRRR